MPDLNLPWIPLFEYGAASTQLTYPMQPFTMGARTEGRLQYTANGVPGANVRLRKYLINVTLRFTEEEWPSIIAWLAFAQYGDAFAWTPDSPNANAQTFLCTLESPRMADIVTPSRDPALVWLMTLPIVLSRQDQPWDIQYFARTSRGQGGAFSFDAFDEGAFFTGG